MLGILQRQVRHGGGQHQANGEYNRITWNFARYTSKQRSHNGLQRRGEVTEHGTPVARLLPFERPERPAILARLEAEGRLRPAKNPGYVPRRLRPVTGTDPSPLTKALLEDRESER